MIATESAGPLPQPPASVPAGMVTFLFTDIEGSTRLWETEQEAMRVALIRHDALLRQSILGNGGPLWYRGLIPGAKTGKRWVFLDVDLADFVRSLYPVQRQALRVTTTLQEGLCHYANAGRSGGSTSLRPTASAYDDLLKPATKPKRKNCTIS